MSQPQVATSSVSNLWHLWWQGSYQDKDSQEKGLKLGKEFFKN
jgi:hypothetical protein